MAQAQRKPIIEPDGTGDNLWREPVVLVMGDGLIHEQQARTGKRLLRHQRTGPWKRSARRQH